MIKPLIFLIFVISSTFLFAQGSKKALVAPNGTHYYIKKFVPDRKINYKILEVVVDSTIDSKIMKFNPGGPNVPDKADKNLLDMLRKKYNKEIKYK